MFNGRRHRDDSARPSLRQRFANTRSSWQSGVTALGAGWNAVLRRVIFARETIASMRDAFLNTPNWRGTQPPGLGCHHEAGELRWVVPNWIPEKHSQSGRVAAQPAWRRQRVLVILLGFDVDRLRHIAAKIWADHYLRWRQPVVSKTGDGRTRANRAQRRQLSRVLSAGRLLCAEHLLPAGKPIGVTRCAVNAPNTALPTAASRRSYRCSALNATALKTRWLARTNVYAEPLLSAIYSAE